MNTLEHRCGSATGTATEQSQNCNHPTGEIPTDNPGNQPPAQALTGWAEKPAQPLRWHEALYRVPELHRVLFETVGLPTPHRIARAYRERFGRSPYGGWPGQAYLYDLPDVIELARWLRERQAAAVTVRFRRGVA